LNLQYWNILKEMARIATQGFAALLADVMDFTGTDKADWSG
jgi:predicted DNA-binding ribbon-helix-helix protein